MSGGIYVTSAGNIASIISVIQIIYSIKSTTNKEQHIFSFPFCSMQTSWIFIYLLLFCFGLLFSLHGSRKADMSHTFVSQKWLEVLLQTLLTKLHLIDNFS